MDDKKRIFAEIMISLIALIILNILASFYW